ncbi:50S ribosomal protein L11 methyltransferase [Pseudomaricurvus alcaniphilus]|uniref:50S ribosomal protein L11 methyltransferase n=1 Tax=Pseudomaricurvus alcaniphilus TaxID=1166482 RepID=UPI001407B1D1|nr:50S ribosomal protein L11 methyltransferase [Pseudomaricurvus alcaniphilus]NHN37017.1 50S ribosomal protein L11 methyltransferase [Pseudomaricurvus alcaniphilus]
MPWLQLRIDTDRHRAAELEDALLAAGAASVTLQDNADQPILEPALGETPLWESTRITGLFDASIDVAAVTRELAGLCSKPLPPHRWEQLEDKDWEREWMQHYQPIDCGNNLWICPSWLQPPVADATNLLLDPGLAFGTGTHPTTFLCLQWLAEQAAVTDSGTAPFANRVFVDYGCGSGILGIAALLLGGQQVTGVDIDPQALLASRDNAARNGIAAERLPVFLPAQCPPVEADILLANILAGPLAQLAPTLTDLTRRGGWLCLSGILVEQADAVMAAYRPWFEFEPVRTMEEWVCLTARKRASPACP